MYKIAIKKQLLPALIILGLLACGDPQVPVSSAEIPAASASSKEVKPIYALNATDNTWPELDGIEILASNLLANNFYIVFDGSGSMAGNQCTDGRSKMDEAKFAVSQFLNRIPADANVGLFVFDMDGISERAPLGQNPRPSLVKIINASRAGGGTPLSAGIEQGYRALTTQAKRQLGYGQYNLVVVTDGEASPGFDPERVVGQVLQNSPVILHTIGFCISGSHSLNQKGKTFYKAANDPKSLVRGLSEVLAEVPDFSVSSFGAE